jgi:glycyl-tRNA synthetase beta chain
MSAKQDTLLIEIGTEELPPKALCSLAAAFSAAFARELASAALPADAMHSFATPRRLALLTRNVPCVQAARTEVRRGPAVANAFDATGQPTKAALGFARSAGVEFAALGRLETADGAWLICEREIPGQELAALVPAMVERALNALPIPKRMRWGAHTTEFVRPVHWVVLLHGADVIPGAVLGIPSGRLTHGHRVHCPQPIELAHADEYVASLHAPGHVIADFTSRRARVVELVTSAARSAGGTAEMADDLLDEVTALVEWPVPIVGSFDAPFLELPAEVLIATMRGHQKYFAVRAADGALINRFVTLANVDSPAPEAIRAGNERVIRPRLSDARFFYHADRKTPLASRVADLDGMLFEKRLGSQGERTRRIVRLVANVATACGAEPALCARAAHLSRADLLTDMVGEFPELQGTMGRYYAAADAEPDAVCTALGEFYQPRFAGDAIPVSAVGRALALTDKLDTLVGVFGIGSPPTGDRDPFALRRTAIGALRILIEGEIELDLRVALDAAAAAFSTLTLAADTVQQVLDFMRERMRGYFIERGVPNDVCAAVFAVAPSIPADVARRLAAVSAFRALPASSALATANKRIANILRKLDSVAPSDFDHAMFEAPAERELARALSAAMARAEQAFSARAYAEYLGVLAELRDSVDVFFEQVMVMCDNRAVRANRLALLGRLHAQFMRVADIAQLAEN